jgi:hypothetical protein
VEFYTRRAVVNALFLVSHEIPVGATVTVKFKIFGATHGTASHTVSSIDEAIYLETIPCEITSMQIVVEHGSGRVLPVALRLGKIAFGLSETMVLSELSSSLNPAGTLQRTVLGAPFISETYTDVIKKIGFFVYTRDEFLRFKKLTQGARHPVFVCAEDTGIYRLNSCDFSVANGFGCVYVGMTLSEITSSPSSLSLPPPPPPPTMLIDETAPTLGADLNVNGHSIITSSTTVITIGGETHQCHVGNAAVGSLAGLQDVAEFRHAQTTTAAVTSTRDGATTLRCEAGQSIMFGVGLSFSGGIDSQGFWEFGPLSPKIKLCWVQGVTSSVDGGWTYVDHGLGAFAEKIITINGVIAHNGAFSAGAVPLLYGGTDGYESRMYWAETQIRVNNVEGNSYRILSKPFRVLIFYIGN